eukprot:Sspe_Gene.3764::Locus_1253_Transcript_2_2_Confidence_0.667_Length_3387::g.3764::m.3764
MSAMLWVAVVVGLVGVGQGSLSFHDTAASLELFVGADRQTYFRVYVGKDQVLRSEGYTSKAGALNGVGSVVVNGMDGGNYRIMDRKDGRKYFNLKAQNHRVIATSSGSFATEAEAAEAAEVVVRGLRTLMLRSQEEYVTMGSVGAEGRAWFRVQRSRNGQYHFHLRLADGQRSVFAHSFRGEKEAREGVVEVFVVGNKKAGYEERVNAIGQHFFQLTRFGGEGQLAISNMYATEEERDEVADMVHAALRSLVQHVVATVVRQAPTAVPAEPAMCTTLETQLMNLVFEVADGKLTPRFMFEGPWLETAELVSAYVVQSAGLRRSQCCRRSSRRTHGQHSCRRARTTRRRTVHWTSTFGSRTCLT